MKSISLRIEQNFSDIFQPIIMTLFAWSLFAISGGMLVIQLALVECTLLFQS